MESTTIHKTQKLKITPKLALQVAFPLILLTIIPLQLAKNTPFFFFKGSSSPNQKLSTKIDDPNNNDINTLNHNSHNPLPPTKRSKCDLFSGEWVPNPNAPYYLNSSCWAIHEHQNCMKYGRPDSEFMKWKWKPDECELPLFNPNQFFHIVRGKSLAFVGDSVARNHMQSLICLLSRAILERENFKGIVYLRTFAPSHFEGGIWNQGGNCLRQKPYKSNEINLQGVDLDLYMAQLVEFKKAQKLGRKRGLRLRLIDMTQPMLLRPDGHPSRYGHWPEENVTLYNDCVHWCLPGPIDTWSDFLLEMIRSEGVIAKEEEKLLYSKERKLKLG